MPDHGPRTKTDVLIAGGGVAALEALLALHERLGSSRRITMLAPVGEFRYRPLAAYRGLTPGLRTTVDLHEIAAEHDAEYLRDHLASVRTATSEADTRGGSRIAYEALVVAIGAIAINPFPGAVTLGLPRQEAAFEAMVERVRAGAVQRVVIVVPPHLSWTLPAYETALMLRHASGLPTMRITVTTPETAPMVEFGPEIADAIADRLRDRDVELCPETVPETIAEDELWVPSLGLTPVDAVVVLARPAGPLVAGLPHDALGFIPVDAVGRVTGTTRVWAAGDATTQATKQGGFALQQVDAVSDDVAMTLTGESPHGEPAAAPLVMRAVLLDGEHLLYLRAERESGRWRGVASWDPLWAPPGKVAGGRLTSYLARRESATG